MLVLARITRSGAMATLHHVETLRLSGAMVKELTPKKGLLAALRLLLILTRLAPAAVVQAPDLLPPLLLDGTYPSLRIDPPSTSTKAPEPEIVEDEFQHIFFPQPHFNFIVSVDGDDNGEHAVISVLTDHRDGTFQCLKTTKKGTEKFELRMKVDKSGKLGESLEKAISAREGGAPTYWLVDKAFDGELLTVERKHPQKQLGMKVGVIYCRPGQTHPQNMFTNGLSASRLSRMFYINSSRR